MKTVAEMYAEILEAHRGLERAQKWLADARSALNEETEEHIAAEWRSGKRPDPVIVAACTSRIRVGSATVDAWKLKLKRLTKELAQVVH